MQLDLKQFIFERSDLDLNEIDTSL